MSSYLYDHHRAGGPPLGDPLHVYSRLSDDDEDDDEEDDDFSKVYEDEDSTIDTNQHVVIGRTVHLDDESSSQFSMILKQVQFSPAIKRYSVISRHEYTKQERKKCWYTQADMIKRNARIDLSVLRINKRKAPRENETFRGLEYLSKKSHASSERRRVVVIQSVLKAQEEQAQVKVKDTLHIAYASMEHSRESKVLALDQAMRDMKEAFHNCNNNEAFNTIARVRKELKFQPSFQVSNTSTLKSTPAISSSTTTPSRQKATVVVSTPPSQKPVAASSPPRTNTKGGSASSSSSKKAISPSSDTKSPKKKIAKKSSSPKKPQVTPPKEASSSSSSSSSMHLPPPPLQPSTTTCDKPSADPPAFYRRIRSIRVEDTFVGGVGGPMSRRR